MGNIVWLDLRNVQQSSSGRDENRTLTLIVSRRTHFLLFSSYFQYEQELNRVKCDVNSMRYDFSLIELALSDCQGCK